MKDKILEATIIVFRDKGMKFTMDDIAKQLSMSKKTIYTIFDDKETLILDMVDYCFDRIKESEKEVLEMDLPTVEKLRMLLGVLPESYTDFDFRQLGGLRERYPRIYQQIEKRLENGWENTIALLEQGMKEGSIRQVNIVIIKTMFEATLEQFFQRDVLERSGLEYADALQQVVDLIIDGLAVRE